MPELTLIFSHRFGQITQKIVILKEVTAHDTPPIKQEFSPWQTTWTSEKSLI